MKQCKCGSYAFNLYTEDIDQGDLCDVHYWKEKALAHPEQELTNIERHEKNVEKFLGNATQPKEPEQEPVAWYIREKDAATTDGCWAEKNLDICEPLYTTPPQRTWVGLEPEDRLCAKYMQDAPDGIEAVIDYIESKLNEKITK